MYNRAIILPYKESFSEQNAGAASIFVKESLVNKDKGKYYIYGSKVKINKKYKKFFFYNPVRAKYFKNHNYINYFINKFSSVNFDTIEIHNRPEYVRKIKDAFPLSKIIFFFHNNPNTLRGSKTYNEKEFLKNSCQIIFLSKWIRDQFEAHNLKNTENKVIYPGVRKIKIQKKQKIIFFCGKLNSAKGYDNFIKATEKLKKLKKYSSWKILSAGIESRRLLPVSKHVTELGQLSNKGIYSIYKKAIIAVAPSKWDEPLGRLPIEASAHGCIPITSGKGGLKETNKDGYILKKNTPDELFNLLKNIISDEDKLKKKSRKVYNNFQYTEKKFQNLISQIRNTKYKINKVFLISNLNLKSKQRLFYSFFNKLNKNLKNNFNSINLSDRDFIRENRNILDPTGRRKFNNEIIKRVKLHNPDLIFLGHTDRIDINTFKKIRSLNYKCKIIKIFIDSISDEFFDFKKVFYDYLYLDNIFISSNTEKLKKYDIFNKIKFIPYPVDTKIDYLKSFRNNYKKTDVFFALSHGQNRGVLKSGKKDEREDFLKEFLKKSNRKFNCKIVGINRVQPVWGKKFYNEIYNSKICLNLSRGHYKKHYSSDRIATLIGNGCFVLNEYKNLYKDFFDKNELIHFKNTKDLIQKINYYLKRPKLMNRIAKKSYIRYHKYFSTKTIINFIIDCVNKNITKKKYIWY